MLDGEAVGADGRGHFGVIGGHEFGQEAAARLREGLLRGKSLDREQFAVHQHAQRGVALFAQAAADLFFLLEGGGVERSLAGLWLLVLWSVRVVVVVAFDLVR